MAWLKHKAKIIADNFEYNHCKYVNERKKAFPFCPLCCHHMYLFDMPNCIFPHQRHCVGMNHSE